MRRTLIPDLSHATDPGRLYIVRSHEMYGFVTGRTTDGKQLLAGVDGTRVLIALFNEAGILIEVARGRLSVSAITADPQVLTIGGYLSRNFGCTQQTIRVKRFHVPSDSERESDLLQRVLIGESGLGIAPFPVLFDEFLDNPSAYNDEDCQNYIDMLSRWISDGNFVLHWGNEYHLNHHGEVIAS